MNTDKFDELIKSKIDEAQFEFNPEHWEKASQLIDKERALHKNSPVSFKKYWIGLFFLLLTLSGVYAIYLNTGFVNSTSNQNNNNDLAAGHLLALAEPSGQSINDAELIHLNETNKNNNDQITEITKSYQKFEQQKESTTAQKNHSNEGDVEIEISNIKVNKNKNEKYKDLSGLKNNLEERNTTVNQQFTTEEKDLEKYSTTELDNSSEELTTFLFLPNIAPKFSASVNEELDFNDNLLRSNTFITKKDDDYYRDKKPKKQFLNVEANAFYNKGWTSMNDKKANAFNFNLGVNYGFYLSRKMSASFGAHFYTIRNVNQSIYSDTISSFNFGVNRTSNTIINNQLAYVSIPLQVNFHINRKNYLSAGVNIGTKVYSRNSVSTSQFVGEQLTSTKLEKNNFNYFNVADRNIMLEASYTGNISKRLWLKAGVFYGVNDLFQQVNGIQNLKGVNIGIKYEIFDK